MMTTELTTYLKTLSQLIEHRLSSLIPLNQGPYQHLFEAARYSILGSGKRIRPILALTATHILGGDQQIALSPACTLELVHTYSCIHDDLPCMDNDDYRRGKLTVHKKYSEGHAVLTGDYLLTYAFEVLAADPQLTPEQKVRLITTLSKHIGGDGMIGGQVMDLAFEGKKIHLELLSLLHRNKTAALMTAAVEFGGIIANVKEDHLDSLRQFGENLGLAFQVVDDILDVTASETKHGRVVASDLVNEKSTYVSLLGLEQSQACAREFYEKAIQALRCLPYDTSLLRELADFVIQRQH